eukprot:1249064-Pyramimonas_sp.AAC.2
MRPWCHGAMRRQWAATAMMALDGQGGGSRLADCHLKTSALVSLPTGRSSVARQRDRARSRASGTAGTARRSTGSRTGLWNGQPGLFAGLSKSRVRREAARQTTAQIFMIEQRGE